MRRNRSPPSWADLKYPFAGLLIGGLIMVGTANYFIDKLYEESFVFGAPFVFLLGMLVAGLSYIELKHRL